MKADGREQPHERGGGVIGVVPVTQDVPLPAPNDGLKAVVLQQQRPVGCQSGDALGKRRGLVGCVHHAEAVDDQVGLRRPGHRRHPPVGKNAEPGAAVRASVLRHGPANGKKSSSLDTRHNIRGLHDEGARLDPFRLFGQRWVFCQLGKAAFRADPHREGIDRIRGWNIRGREVIARGLLTEVEGQSVGMAAARSTF